MIQINGITIDLENDSAEVLADHVIKGDLTIEDLEKNQESHLYAQSKRNCVQHLVEAHEQKDPEEYNKAETEGTIEAYQAYLEQFPDGQYSHEAKQIIEQMKEEQRQEELWNALNKEDPDAIKKYIENEPNSPYRDQANKLRRQLLAPKPSHEDNIKWIKTTLEGLGRITYDTIKEVETACKIRGPPWIH